MDSQRNLFIIAFLFVSFMIWQTWQTDQMQQASQFQSTTNVNAQNSVAHEQNNIIPGSATTKPTFITVKTDVLSLTINTRGGDVEQAKLLTYPAALGASEPFHLLENTTDFVYQAQSGLTGRNGPDNPSNGSRPIYKTTQEHFELLEGQDSLRVPLTFTADNGVVYNKTFILKRGQYSVDVAYDVDNVSEQPLELVLFGQLKQSLKLPKYLDTGNSNFALHTFRGAAYSTSNEKYEKYGFDTIAENKNLNTTTHQGWIAMLQQYFSTAWIPRTHGANTFYTSNLGNGLVAIGYKSSPVTLEPGAQQSLNATLWIGPEIQDEMAAVAPHLDLTVDYGWLWFISQPLFKLLKFLHGFVGNWGVSIILITFIVRGIMYPLTKAQYTSMAKMRMLQPKIQTMRERIGDDKQRMSQEMMALYKAEKVNPLGGCLPLIIQMPIFLALYYMLMGTVQLRHAPFALWIHDLSAQDPYYILPLLMGLTMFFIQKMSPTTVTDPMQQKIMNWMPLIFTVFFLWFPSGLVLYYIVSNLVTILQQQIIYKGLEKRGLHYREKSDRKKK